LSQSVSHIALLYATEYKYEQTDVPTTAHSLPCTIPKQKCWYINASILTN
jgi:hypothetical protein